MLIFKILEKNGIMDEQPVICREREMSFRMDDKKRANMKDIRTLGIEILINVCLLFQSKDCDFQHFFDLIYIVEFQSFQIFFFNILDVLPVFTA